MIRILLLGVIIHLAFSFGTPCDDIMEGEHNVSMVVLLPLSYKVEPKDGDLFDTHSMLGAIGE